MRLFHLTLSALFAFATASVQAADTNTLPAPPPASTNSAPVPAPEETPAATVERPTSYTVVSGDSLYKIAHQFHVSIKRLKKANKLTRDNLKPGQVLIIPPLKPQASTAPTAETPSAPNNPEMTSPDHPLATASAEDGANIPSTAYYHPDAPKALPVDLAETPSDKIILSQNTLVKGPSVSSKSPSNKTTIITTTRYLVKAPVPALAVDTSAATSAEPSVPDDLAHKFRFQADRLAAQGIEYGDDWRPPGEQTSWKMDCSNTSRYLYKVTTGLELPRTASDQYYQLHLQNKAWDVPTTGNGAPDVAFLRRNLQPGDLLFWEYTYKPDRDPPITHVMIYLGPNANGQWLMVGSQSGPRGEHHRSKGGPDIYLFDPLKPSGGYTTWLGMVHHRGQFCAFGRPLSPGGNELAMAR